MSKKRKRLIKKIDREISSCQKDDRKHILTILAKNVDRVDLQQNIEGIVVFYRIMDDELLQKLSDFITVAIEKTRADLTSDTESD